MSFNSWFHKTTLYQNFLILLCLAGAIYSAYNVGNSLSWAGILYYTLCILAVLKNNRRVLHLLWAAVGIHAVLISYSLWQWSHLQVVPCHYCFAAAGLLLTAAVTRIKLPAVILPLILMVGVGFAWPWIFAKQTDLPNTRPAATQANTTSSSNTKTEPSKDSDLVSEPVTQQETKTVPVKTNVLATKEKVITQTGIPLQKSAPVQPEPTANTNPSEDKSIFQAQDKLETTPEEKTDSGSPAESPPKSG